MTKKIRLMDDEATTEPTANAVLEVSSMSINPANDMTIKQVMKYLEAIDWKLWEMLKLMKAQAETESEEEEEK